LNFKLFCQIHLVPLRIGFGHQNKFCSLQNSEELLFWWNFGSSSTFGRILQNHKTGWLELATVLEQGDALPPGQSRCVQRRHAPGHAAAWLREPAVMWTSPSMLIHSPR
jgi:hypothetical protein